MNKEQITALAHEYIKCCRYGSQVNPDVIVESYRFLLDHYCLVHKGEVKGILKHISSMIDNDGELGLDWLVAVGESNKALLETLFPEIVKEISNE